MNKEKIYAEISKLFPKELGVRDLVKLRKLRGEWKIADIDEDGALLVDMSKYTKGGWISERENKKDLKLIRKNITGEDILKMFNKVRKFHTHLELSNKGYLTYWESSYDDRTKQEDWILGKPLYDQSIDLIKLVQEVLK